MAILCAAAAIAPAAHASEFKADSYPTTIDGTAGSQHVFGFGEIQFACKQAVFQGELQAAATELTVTPVYSECVWVEMPVRVTMNGCDYAFSSLKPVKSGEYQGLFAIKCPAGKLIALDLELLGMTLCTLTVPAQSNLEKVNFVDNANKEGTGDDDLTETFSVSGIAYAVHFSSGCPIKAGEYTNLSYQGISTVKGTNKEGKQIGLRVE